MKGEGDGGRVVGPVRVESSDDDKRVGLVRGQVGGWEERGELVLIECVIQIVSSGWRGGVGREGMKTQVHAASDRVERRVRRVREEVESKSERYERVGARYLCLGGEQGLGKVDGGTGWGGEPGQEGQLGHVQREGRGGREGRGPGAGGVWDELDGTGARWAGLEV